MPVIPIDSLDDPRLDDYAHRTDVELRNFSGRAGDDVGHGVYLAESAIVLERALRAGHRPRSVLALGATVEEAVRLVGDEVPIFTGPDALLTALTGYALHRGLVASLSRPALAEPAALLADARTVVILENVVDPTNVGAIFRSVAGVGADAVLVTADTADPFYRRAIRVSMGTVLQVPWTRLSDWPATRRLLDAAGFSLAALALRDDAQDLRPFAAARPERLALAFGSEGHGLTEEALGVADAVVRIPMRHGVDSLNVAAASAVALWAVAASPEK